MSKHSNFISTLSLASLLLTGCTDKSPEGRIQAAKQALQAADYKTATIDLKEALQGSPSNIEARLLLGQVLQDQEQWAASEKELRKALELGGAPERIFPLLTHTLVQLGRYQEALNLDIPKVGLSSQTFASLQAERANAQMALNKPTEAAQAISEGEQALIRAGVAGVSQDLQLAKAMLVFLNNQPKQAMSILDAALREKPKFVKALAFKARLFQADNNEPEAIKVYKQILDINPKNFLALLSITHLYQKAGNIDAADKSIQSLETFASGHPLVLYARATIDLRRGNTKKANDAIMNVLQMMPNHLPSILLGATTNFALGNYEQSRKNAEYVLAQIPNNIYAGRLLAASMLKMNNPQEAINTLLPLVDVHKDDATLLAMVGEAYLKTHDYNKAMYYLDRATRLAPENAAFKSQKAVGHWARGETELALSTLEQASTMDTESGQAGMVLIMLQLERRNYDQALKTIAVIEKRLPENPVIHNLRAAAYLGKNNLSSARQSLERALAIDPKFYPATANLARLDIQSNNPDSARKRFESILAADKNNVPAMLALAEMAASSNQEKEQLKWLEKAIKIDTKALQPRIRMINYYLSKGKTAEAITQARDVVNQNQEWPEALDLLGTTQLAADDKKAAIATFIRLTTKAPASPQAYYHLALAQLAAKDRLAATASLRQAESIDADFLPTQDTLIQIEMDNARPESALAIARKMQTRQPKSPFGFEREGDVLLAQKRHTQAAKAYQHAIELGARTAALIKLHRALTQTGDIKAAEQLLNGWINQHPTDMVVHDYAAAYFLATGRNRDAIQQYEILLKTSRNNAVALNNLATLYLSEKNGHAQATAEEALKLKPNQPNIMDTLAWILLEKGQTTKAIELLKSAVSLAPRAGGIRYHYAVALARAGKKHEARKELEDAIASGEKFTELENAKAMLKDL